MKRTTITIIDIIAYLVNDLLAWFIVIWFDLTGYDNKFQNIRLHWLILIIGILQQRFAACFSIRKREQSIRFKLEASCSYSMRLWHYCLICI